MKKVYWILPAIICVLAACSNSNNSSSGTYTVLSSASATATTSSIGNTFGSPTSLKQKFYAAWISPNEDCSAPVLLQDLGDAGKLIEFYSGETIFSGTPADGTYKCLIVKISDIQTFVPDATAEQHWGATLCSTATTYTEDIFKAQDSSDPYLNKDGTTINGEGTYTVPVEQTIYVYLTTNTAATIALGANTQQVLSLSAPLVVPGQGTFYTDYSNQVGLVLNDTVCWVEEPKVGFR